MASDYDIARAAASVYAESALELATEAGRADAVAEELSDLQTLWQAEPAFAAMMSSAAIDEDARRESIRRVFGNGRVSPIVLNMLLVLNDKRRAMILPLVCDAYRRKLDARLGREEVSVTSATPLDDRHRETIRREVRRLTGREAILVERIVPEVLGGLKLQVSDRLYDMTIHRRLRTLRKSLLAAGERYLRDAASRFIAG